MDRALRQQRIVLAMAFRLKIVSPPLAHHARGVSARSHRPREILCGAGTSTCRRTGPIASPRPPVAPRTAVVVGVATPVGDADTRTDTSADQATFQWTKQWYPLVPLKLLEESQGEGYASGVPEIQRQSILGRDIVLWKDSEGKWRAVEDRCAHRLAALSLGSVREDGTLACRYHGECGMAHARLAPATSSQRMAPMVESSRVMAAGA